MLSGQISCWCILEKNNGPWIQACELLLQMWFRNTMVDHWYRKSVTTFSKLHDIAFPLSLWKRPLCKTLSKLLLYSYHLMLNARISWVKQLNSFQRSTQTFCLCQSFKYFPQIESNDMGWYFRCLWPVVYTRTAFFDLKETLHFQDRIWKYFPEVLRLNLRIILAFIYW